MRNLYLTEVKDGQTLLHEVNFKTTIDPEVLMSTTLVQKTKHFYYDNREFQQSVYVEAGLVTQVIKCETLYWQIPLKYNEVKDIFQVHTCDLDQHKQHKIGIENCTLIIHTGINARDKYNMYICNKDKRSPMVTNIYADGRLCVPLNFDVTTPPENIIALLESCDGNSDLLTDHESGNSDSYATIPLYLKNGITYAKPYTEHPLNHEKHKYLKHQNDIS
jgi:hypothetical protein